MVPLKTTERHWSAGLRYRLGLGHRSTSPTLTFSADYGSRSFTVDRSNLQPGAILDLPDVDYKGFDPGVSFRLPLGERFAITVGGSGLLATSAGPIQSVSQYGTAQVIGGSASAGFDVRIIEHVALRLAAEATQIQLKFQGVGTQTTSRDGDPSTVDVRGATDRYYGGVATLAVTY
jgi:hypothetical protein